MKTVRGMFFLVVVGAFATSAFAAPNNKRSAASNNAGAAAVRSEVSASSQWSGDYSSAGRVEFEPNFGMAFMSPGDINSLIRDTNDSIQKQGVKSFSLGEFGSSMGFGFATTYKLATGFGLGMGFTRLASSTDASAKVNQNDNLSSTWNIAANLLTAESRVRFAQSPDGRFEGILAPSVGLGFYNASNEFSGSALQNGSTEVRSNATGVVFGSTIGARYWVSRNFSLGLNAGYRFAKSGTLKVDSQKNTNQAVGSQAENNGKKVSLDASSVMINAGVVWAL